MTWLAAHGLDILGWGGSALLVFSLLQSRVLRFRVLNLVACVVLVVFNALVEVWPMVGMNVVLCAINLWFIVRLLRERHDDAAFTVLAVRPDDTYLRHVLAVHGADIARHQPDLTPLLASVLASDLPDHAYLVLKEDETVGVVLLERDDADPTVARVVLDYVTPRYRDFSPGEFVWRHSDLLAGHGFATVRTSPRMVAPYYDRVGFTRDGDAWVLPVAS
jgi:hypothetical protein